MKQLGAPFFFENSHKSYLASIQPYVGKWSLKTNEMKEVKAYITEQLLALQGKYCAYCGFELEITSEKQIEHIAPKGGTEKTLYPEFTFTEANLAFACSFCNGFSKKGTVNTISNYNSDYQLCTFNIVHPYFDNPDDHFNWINGESIIIQSKTDKGKESINMFKLDSPQISIQRAKMRDANFMANLQLPQTFYDKIGLDGNGVLNGKDLLEIFSAYKN